MSQTASIYILPTLMIVAAISDVSAYRIPNWLTGLIAVLFFPMALLTQMPIVEFGWHLAAGVLLFFVGYGLFALGLFGGGDSKLMAAAGLWFGTSQTMSFLILTAVAGGILALVVAGWSVFMGFWHYYGAAEGSTIDRQLKKLRPKLPYGVALAAGAILAFPQTWWMNVA